MDTKKDQFSGFVLLFTFGLLLLAFSPIIFWVGQNVLLHEQLKTAFTIWIACAILLWFRSGLKFRKQFELSYKVLSLLVLTALCMLGAKYLQIPTLNLGSLCFLVSSIALSFLGSKAERYILSLSVAMAFFLFLLQSLNLFDWPMRIFAGKMSRSILELFGQNVELVISGVQENIRLIMMVNQKPFDVAAECNGFGLFTSSLMVSVVFSLYSKRGYVDKILSIALSSLAALLINSFRITIIVLLAPIVGKHYMLMHEIAGLLCFYLGLGMVYWICKEETLKDKSA